MGTNSYLCNQFYRYMRHLIFTRTLCFVLAPWIVLLTACGSDTPSADKTPKTAPAAETTTPNLPKAPDEVFGALFEAVQMNRVFPDGKTFADCTPKADPETILQQYAAQKDAAGFDLSQFVATHFTMPVPHSSQFKSDLRRSPADHINALWPILTRPADTAAALARSTLLPLPYPYVVPGGRFGEVYYWDSYFTMLGLQAAGREDLIQMMVRNFAHLIDRYGHIPNGNRTYYISRSQPPFFSVMQTLLYAGNEGPGAAFLPQLEKEYAFWMDGADQTNGQNPAYRRVVRLSDSVLLNRYWDDRPLPRPEAYREDVEVAQKAAGRPKEAVYRHLKASAESGWDFSSRWMDGNDLSTIHTSDIVPVDLNCLMWHLEDMLADLYLRKGDADKAKFYAKRALLRSRFLVQSCFSTEAGWFMDYNFVKKTQTGVLSLAGMYPLFFKLARPAQAKACATTLQKSFLRPGGLVTTPNNTGQQWDAPNGWAPLQWISIVGLRNYEQTELANDVKKRWVDLNTKVYKRTGKMLEKYNVEDLSLTAGGGEYPVQDGFGWTNGVLLKLLSEK